MGAFLSKISSQTDRQTDKRTWAKTICIASSTGRIAVTGVSVSSMENVRTKWCERNFYRAMLCIARTLLSQDVCTSVRPSVTRQYSVETVRRIIKLFHRRVATSEIPNVAAIFRRGRRMQGDEIVDQQPISLYLRNDTR